MPKKNFTANAIADATAEVLPGQIELETGKHNAPRKTYSEEEAAAFMAAGKTSGRKGLEQGRINMAFYPEVYDFIKISARATGQTMTAFVNKIILQFMAEHQEVYQQAKAIAKGFEQ